MNGIGSPPDPCKLSLLTKGFEPLKSDLTATIIITLKGPLVCNRWIKFQRPESFSQEAQFQGVRRGSGSNMNLILNGTLIW